MSTRASPARTPQGRARDLGFVTAWHGAFALGALSAAGVLGLLSGGVGPQSAALIAMAAPGVLAQGLWLIDRRPVRTFVMGTWGAGAALAVVATGGLAGPLAAWCLAPLAAALCLGGAQRLRGGAALALAVAAVALLTALGGGPEQASSGGGFGLSFFALAATVIAFASAMLFVLGRERGRMRAYRVAQRRTQGLLAGLPVLVITADGDGRVRSAFGRPPAGVSIPALLEQGLLAVVHGPDRATARAALGALEPAFGFTPAAALDRHVRLAARRRSDGRLICVLADDSDQHAREAMLEQARIQAEQLNAGKSRFLANMSHELRTPLNAVIGFSEIMQQKMFGPLPEKYWEYAQLIHESGGHLLALINDVLDMSKIEAERYELSLEVFDARDPVASALRLVRLQAHEAQVGLRGMLPSVSVAVEADRRALKQITLNLLSNALKFTPAGGQITVTLEARGANLELVVADTGVGVAPEDVERLGKPYEQADAGRSVRGTGLGLSLVRAFAELHGGSMSIESTLGAGTAVTVRLPVLQEARDMPSGGAQVIPLTPRG